MNFKTFVAVCMLCFCGLFAGNAAAQGIGSKLNDALDSMSNYTPPSVHKGARRTIITGGSLSIKMQTGAMGGFAFRPPSVSVGCGGIDGFFGAFSMISKEQIMQALRGIVTGAIVYAFKLAISTICEKCATWMADIGDLLAEANNWLIDSCGATYNAMVSKFGDPTVPADQRSKNYATSTGASSDAADATKQGSRISAMTNAMRAARTGGGSGAGSGPNSNALTEPNMAFGNHVWRILTGPGASVYTLGGGNSFNEEMMSLVGAVIVCGGEMVGCPKADVAEQKQEGEPDWRPVPYTMRLTDLVSGKKGELSGGAKDAVKVLRCESHERTGCINPTPSADSSYQTLESRFRRAFLGSSGGSMGIIHKLRHARTEAMTPEEEIWMKTGGSYVGQLIKLARLDENAARSFANDFAEIIVAQMAVEFVRDLYAKLRIAAGNSQLSGLQAQYDMFVEAEKRLEEDYSSYQKEASGKSAQFEAYIARINSLRQ